MREVLAAVLCLLAERLVEMVSGRRREASGAYCSPEMALGLQVTHSHSPSSLSSVTLNHFIVLET